LENHKSITITEFDYPLPESRIAIRPLPQRDDSKILVYKDKCITSSTFPSIVGHLLAGDLMVYNNTRVVQARIRFKKPTGASIEIFILEPEIPSDYQQAFASTIQTVWYCMVGNVKRWKGEILSLPLSGYDSTLEAKLVERRGEGALVHFSWSNAELSFARVIELCGEMPIPPYLNRPTEDEDRTRYQTVYAKPEGSVAAPTAGLHFTPEIFNRLDNKGVHRAEVTLHVGAGTFQPVKGNTIGDHLMHTESIQVSIDTIDSILSCSGNIIAVGTTSLRTLESLYWLGARILKGVDLGDSPFVDQWDGYGELGVFSPREALVALKDYITKQGKDYISAVTRMIIVPGYRFRLVNALVTNFHQPRSTLLLLVAAFTNGNWQSIYTYALDNDFRFLSYGDSSLLFNSDNDYIDEQ
jgi:S-adenosylmethionine:tRNA ribosyltransferase-isomerase